MRLLSHAIAVSRDREKEGTVFSDSDIVITKLLGKSQTLCTRHGCVRDTFFTPCP